MKIGAKLKDMRLSAQLTQSELADRADVTKGFISQVENDQTSLSVDSMGQILAALGVSFAEFFSDTAAQTVVFSPKDRIRVSDKGASVFEILVPGSTMNEMDPAYVTLAPGESFEEDEPHNGEEFGYVLNGVLTVQLGKKQRQVPARSCFYFESNQAHRLLNRSPKNVTFLWVTTPPQM